MTRIVLAGSAVLGFALLAAAPAAARQAHAHAHALAHGHRIAHRHPAHRPVRRPPNAYDGDPSVGRNAVPAIANGLGGLAGGWIDTIGNAWANPTFRDDDYFAYYRRPY